MGEGKDAAWRPLSAPVKKGGAAHGAKVYIVYYWGTRVRVYVFCARARGI